MRTADPQRDPIAPCSEAPGSFAPATPRWPFASPSLLPARECARTIYSITVRSGQLRLVSTAHRASRVLDVGSWGARVADWIVPPRWRRPISRWMSGQSVADAGQLSASAGGAAGA